MSVLSAQSIRKLCTWPQVSPLNYSNIGPYQVWHDGNPLVSPFVERGVQNGKSYGLSACTYDCRIAHHLLLPVWSPGMGRLAVTQERFVIPKNICGTVLDKSTHARVFVSAFNTHLDPGWFGHLTVELINMGDEALDLVPGDPIIQIKFEWLDEATDLPYAGKYNDQPMEPVPARSEV